MKKTPQKNSRNRRQPSVPDIQKNYTKEKSVKYNRRKSLPTETFRVQRNLSTPMTFGMLDPKDESFQRNAKIPNRLRNGENTRTRRKSINSKVGASSKYFRFCVVTMQLSLFQLSGGIDNCHVLYTFKFF